MSFISFFTYKDEESMGRGKYKQIFACTLYIKRPNPRLATSQYHITTRCHSKSSYFTSNEGYKQIGMSFMLDQNQEVAITMTTN